MSTSGGHNGRENLSINVQTLTPIQQKILENNTYAKLADDDDNESDSSYVTLNSQQRNKRRRDTTANEKLKSSSQPAKPPPIFLKGIARAELDKILSKLDIERSKFLSKNLPGGIKVFASDTESHKLLREHLTANQLKFQTHLLREEQTTKIVLHGLHNMELSVLKNELSRFTIFPADIKIMNTRKKNYDDHCVYLLYFSKASKVRISDLREIRALCYTRVKWEYYQNRRRGPIQCSNCMQFGHGGKNCFLDPTCIRCGECHKSSDCPLITEFDPVTQKLNKLTRIPDEKLKCGLCGKNHTANSKHCEKRKQFIERQQKYRTKNQKRPQFDKPHVFQNAPELNNFNFPSLPRTPHNQRLYNNPRPFQNDAQQNNKNDLFSPNELMEIFVEMMSVFKAARTRQDQMLSLAQLLFKHCYGSK